MFFKSTPKNQLNKKNKGVCICLSSVVIKNLMLSSIWSYQVTNVIKFGSVYISLSFVISRQYCPTVSPIYM